ncbi:MAG: cyclase family protein [Pirellulaceae bacterium]|nr:cyclase family protein [Pirellulaceae bacterium]
MIDLSLPITNEMPGVQIEVDRVLERDGWNATNLNFYSHCGTHMDAPCHFLPGGRSLDQQDLDVVCGTAIIVDLTPAEPRQLITIDDLEPVADRVSPGCRLLFRTDWYRRYGTPAYRDELPRISLPLAQWLVDQKVSLIGVEPPSVADVNNLSEVTEVHQTLFRGDVVIVEGLCHLDQIQSPTVQFIALPLKIIGGDGSPLRAIAIDHG